jgi:hypothetical protein
VTARHTEVSIGDREKHTAYCLKEHDMGRFIKVSCSRLTTNSTDTRVLAYCATAEFCRFPACSFFVVSSFATTVRTLTSATRLYEAIKCTKYVLTSSGIHNDGMQIPGS